MPTATVNIAAGGDDAYAYRQGAAYPPAYSGHITANPGNYSPYRGFLSPNYGVRQALWKFDTGTVSPDSARVVSASLRLRITNLLNADNRNLTMELRPAFRSGENWNRAWTNDRRTKKE